MTSSIKEAFGNFGTREFAYRPKRHLENGTVGIFTQKTRQFIARYLQWYIYKAFTITLGILKTPLFFFRKSDERCIAIVYFHILQHIPHQPQATFGISVEH